MHIDFHGKANRKGNREIDVGARAMEVVWKGHCEEVVLIKEAMTRTLNEAFAGL